MNDKTKDRAKTAYVVLKAVPSGDGTPVTKRAWSEAATIEAANSADAVRRVAKEAAGEYVAVPARSFVPVTVKVETRTVVKLT